MKFKSDSVEGEGKSIAIGEEEEEAGYGKKGSGCFIFTSL